MQTKLAFPIVGRNDHKAAEDALVAALEHPMQLLTDSGGEGTGEAHFVVRHLIACALSDLMAALHLARHGYLSQAYNAVRTAYETQDLIELIVAHPEEAAKWVNTEQDHKDFPPGAVRQRIGKPSFDEMYGHYSELAHPRFAGSRLSTFGKRHTENGRSQNPRAGRGDDAGRLGDLGEGLAFREQCPDLLPPGVIALVALRVG